MSTYLKVSAMIVLIAAVLSAAPLCTQDTYTNYQALLATGCTIGDETFSNFSGLTFSNSLGVSTLSSDQVLVTPTTVDNEATLAFTYGTSASPLTILLVDNSQAFAFDFTYEAIAASGLVLTGIQQTATFSNTTPGSTSFTKNAEAMGGGPIFVSAVTDGGASHVAATYSGPVTAVTAPNSDFLVKDAISLQAQSGSVSNSGFNNNFFTGPTTTNTPEPPVSLLIGSGLVLLSGLTRKAAAHRRRKNA